MNRSKKYNDVDEFTSTQHSKQKISNQILVGNVIVMLSYRNCYILVMSLACHTETAIFGSCHKVGLFQWKNIF